MKTNYVPAMVMLTAGFIDCVFGIVYHQEFKSFAIQLLIVLVIFYMIGVGVKIILDRNFNEMKDPEKIEEDSEEVFDEDVEGEPEESEENFEEKLDE